MSKTENSKPVYETNPLEFEKDGKVLYGEAIQLKKIISTIIKNST